LAVRLRLGGIAAVLAPGSSRAQAQPGGGMRRIGALLALLENDPVGQTRAKALVEALGALNWKEGDNIRIIRIDWRWAGRDPALFERYATELVALRPDLLLANGTPSVAAMQRQTSTIPIVFVNVTDPVGQGFVASISRPGGNITGFTDFDPPMANKWLSMLAQISPPAARTAVLFNPATAPYAGLMLRAVEEAAPSFALAVRVAPCRDGAEIEAVVTELARDEHGGLLVLPDAFTFAKRAVIVESAARNRLPAIYWNRSFVADGGLMSYGVDNTDAFRRGRLCRAHPQGREAGRPAGANADQVRTGDQSQDRKNPRRHLCARAPRHRRRGDRMRRHVCRGA
jgi:putative ABC transport system substrate-binding protein